jgi:hypothetical protein
MLGKKRILKYYSDEYEALSFLSKNVAKLTHSLTPFLSPSVGLANEWAFHKVRLTGLSPFSPHTHTHTRTHNTTPSRIEKSRLPGC